MFRILIVLFTLLKLSIVFASNLSFLDSAPISDFTPADTKMFEDAIQTALNDKKDGEKLAWKNEKTGVSGLLNPLSSFKENDTQCRNLRIVNRSKNKIAQSKFKFCKKNDKWVAIELIK